MKTLVNKVNPAIRMTAPEIDAHEEEDMYFIPVSNYCIPMCMEDWELVEEEPEKIYYKMLDNKANCPFDKGDCRYCTVQFCGAREENHIETHSTAEPVDLEKAAQHYTYLIPQTFEEKVEMYMKCEKKTLAEMLAMRDIIMTHKNPPQEPVLTKTK